MDARFAFTAQFWGDRAVVCRAVEDRPGPVVEQQFGEFPTWTQAQTCACKLNEGLDLDPLEVRQIVTSSFLATARVIQEALNSKRWLKSPTVNAARAPQFRFIVAELALALTFCRAAAMVSGSPLGRMLSQARQALLHSADFLLKNSDDDNPAVAEIASQAKILHSVLRTFPLSSAPSPRDWPDKHECHLASDLESNANANEYPYLARTSRLCHL